LANRSSRGMSLADGRPSVVVGNGWGRIPGKPSRINDRNPSIKEKPDPPERVCRHGPAPLHAFRALQSVRHPILAHVSVTERAAQQFVAVHPHYVTRSSDPEPATFVFRDAEDRFV